MQRAIRDTETRVLFSGYAAANYKLFVFVVAAIIAALGGALYVPQVGIINPSEMAPEKSLEAVVWCAVGGRGTLIGPIIGAIGVNALKSWATRAFPDLLAHHPRRPVHPRRALHAQGHRRPARRRSRELLARRKAAPESEAAPPTADEPPPSHEDRIARKSRSSSPPKA